MNTGCSRLGNSPGFHTLSAFTNDLHRRVCVASSIGRLSKHIGVVKMLIIFSALCRTIHDHSRVRIIRIKSLAGSSDGYPAVSRTFADTAYRSYYVKKISVLCCFFVHRIRRVCGR